MAQPLSKAAMAFRECGLTSVKAKPLDSAMPPAFSFRASADLVPEPKQTPKADRRALETLSQSLLNFV